MVVASKRTCDDEGMHCRSSMQSAVSQSVILCKRNNSKGRDWHRGCEAGAWVGGGADEIKSVKSAEPGRFVD